TAAGARNAAPVDRSAAPVAPVPPRDVRATEALTTPRTKHERPDLEIGPSAMSAKRTSSRVDRATVSADRANVLRLEPLRAPLDFELHRLTLGQGGEPLRLDRGVMAEDVLTAVILLDEAKALRLVEPLHGTSCHCLDLPAVRAASIRRWPAPRGAERGGLSARGPRSRATSRGASRALGGSPGSKSSLVRAAIV